MTDALVIGGGPAGLMAAEALLQAGRKVVLAEAKPSLARKFLMAGKSGLNLTKVEESDRFFAAYDVDGGLNPALRRCLDQFGPAAVRDWAEGLGQDVFVGSTGRLFPKAMKASPLLRTWLARLDQLALERQVRWRWAGWDGAETVFDTPEGAVRLQPKVTVLALGGGSWARLGSDGAWQAHFKAAGVPTVPFQPSNAGLVVNWSDHMIRHFGTPLKGIALRAGDMVSRGEVVISKRGLEGGGIYPLTPALRNGAELVVDLLPDLDLQTVSQRLSKPRGKQSLSNVLRKAAKLSPAAHALLMEYARPLPNDPKDLARTLKSLTLRYDGLRPLDEAISTVGGVPFAALDETLMLRERPGVFCAGEMIDWDAPTGGYLLTACFATGRWAGQQAAAHTVT